MQRIKLCECNFHDSTIINVTYSNELLTLYLSESYYENAYNNVRVEIPVNISGLEIFHIKQYPRFHKVRLKGREISVDNLKFMFKNSVVLEVDQMFVSVEMKFLVFECDVIPSPRRRGSIEKIIFKIEYIDDYFVFKEENDL